MPSPNNAKAIEAAKTDESRETAAAPPTSDEPATT